MPDRNKMIALVIECPKCGKKGNKVRIVKSDATDQKTASALCDACQAEIDAKAKTESNSPLKSVLKSYQPPN